MAKHISFWLGILLGIVIAAGTSAFSGEQTSHVEESSGPQSKFIAAAALDTVTTRLAITSGMGAEANPLGEAGVIVAKAAYFAWVKSLPEEEQAEHFGAAVPIFTAFSVNNAAVLFGFPTPIALLAGLVAFIAVAQDEP